jgi:hypothetical protein
LVLLLLFAPRFVSQLNPEHESRGSFDIRAGERPEWAFLASCFEPLGSCRSKREELVELMPAMIKFEA